MISDAWYPIHYFKLSFGKADSLFDRIIEIQQLLNIPIDADKALIRETILSKISDPKVRKCLNIFTLNVPYWFLSPWIKEHSQPLVASASTSSGDHCPYAIYGQEIVVSEAWAEYFRVNAQVLKDFCYWNLVRFLQQRNPNVPDIPAKLVKPISRSSLTSQHKYWNKFLSNNNHIHCIYTGKELHTGDYDLDHFVPWSFVAHDLLWNLIPADPSINSSKSNNLPILDDFLKPMALLQKEALSSNYLLNPNDRLLEDYLVFRCSLPELIALPDDDFVTLFQKQFTPMVQTAMNMGFALWNNSTQYGR